MANKNRTDDGASKPPRWACIEVRTDYEEARVRDLIRLSQPSVVEASVTGVIASTTPNSKPVVPEDEEYNTGIHIEPNE